MGSIEDHGGLPREERPAVIELASGPLGVCPGHRCLLELGAGGSDSRTTAGSSDSDRIRHRSQHARTDSMLWQARIYFFKELDDRGRQARFRIHVSGVLGPPI